MESNTRITPDGIELLREACADPINGVPYDCCAEPVEAFNILGLLVMENERWYITDAGRAYIAKLDACIPEVTTRYYDERLPAVNVKVYGQWDNTNACMTEFGCTREIAERACEFAFNGEQRSFWEYWLDKTGDLENGLYGSPEYAIFTTHHGELTINSNGRSGGWLTVDGLPDLEMWDLPLFAEWAAFVDLIKEDIKARLDFSAWKDTIAVNGWIKPHAEEYNMLTTEDGHTRCIADLNAAIVEMTAAFERGDGVYAVTFENKD